MRPEFQKPLFILQVQDMLGLATPMEKTESGQNPRRAFNKAIGLGKKYKTNKPRNIEYINM